MSLPLTIGGRVQLYCDWRGCLFGLTFDDAVLALMFGPFTVEVWW